MDYNFYRDGGNGECRVSSMSPYMPSVMRQLSTTRIMDMEPRSEVNAIVRRPQVWLDNTQVEVITSSVNQELHEILTREENKAFSIGTRSDEPQGLFTSPNFQRIEGRLTVDNLISFIYTLGASYRRGASWLVNPSTVASLSLLTDRDGHPIYQPPSCRGVQGMLFDWPLFEEDHVPLRQLAFGKFTKAYNIYSSPETVITRDPFSKKPMVIFQARRAVFGAADESAALKVFNYGR